MKKIKDWRIIEPLVYWAIWLVLIFLPLVFWEFDDQGQRHRIIIGWIRIFPFLLIFIIHNNLLFPHLLIKNKRTSYFISVIIVIFIINYFFFYIVAFQQFLYNLLDGISPAGNPDFHGIKDMPGKIPHIPGMRHGKGWNYPRGSSLVYVNFTYNVIISVILVGFNAALKFTSKWMKEEQGRKEIEKQNLQSQLSFLQHQVSPHFFMNTLNNIHALIDYSQDDAKDAILRLSKMMRYLLYDSEQGKTTLSKEIEFLNSYIDLMRLRLHKDVELNIRFPKGPPQAIIPPFLFLSFVENAFKHGISYRKKSFIHILIEITGNKTHFNIKNSKSSSQEKVDGRSGIGLENAKKRMDLLFGKDYSLNVYDRENEYEVDLIFPLYEHTMHSN